MVYTLSTDIYYWYTPPMNYDLFQLIIFLNRTFYHLTGATKQLSARKLKQELKENLQRGKEMMPGKQKMR